MKDTFSAIPCVGQCISITFRRTLNHTACHTDLCLFVLRTIKKVFVQKIIAVKK